MRHEQLLAILADIKILDRLFIVTPVVCCAPPSATYGWHLQVTYNEADVDTGKIEQQYSRKWYIADDATESDIVDTAFAAVMRSYDHVVQEHFTYKGQRVFSPHFPIETRFAMAAVDKAVRASAPRAAIALSPTWLAEAARQAADDEMMTESQREQREVEGVLAAFEHFLYEGLFPTIDADLKTFDVERVAPATLVAILSITFHAKDKLKHRDAFLTRAEARLVAALGAERAEALLTNRR